MSLSICLQCCLITKQTATLGSCDCNHTKSGLTLYIAHMTAAIDIICGGNLLCQEETGETIVSIIILSTMTREADYTSRDSSTRGSSTRSDQGTVAHRPCLPLHSKPDSARRPHSLPPINRVRKRTSGTAKITPAPHSLSHFHLHCTVASRTGQDEHVAQHRHAGRRIRRRRTEVGSNRDSSTSRCIRIW